MAAMEGMIVDEVQTAVSQLSSYMSELQTLITNTQGVVSKLETAWSGPDASQFQAQWPSYHSQLTAALNGLTEMHTHVQNNLTAQTSASNSY